jgi:hypothetical protein
MGGFSEYHKSRDFFDWSSNYQVLKEDAVSCRQMCQINFLFPYFGN